jgi:hypothetical protein
MKEFKIKMWKHLKINNLLQQKELKFYLRICHKTSYKIHFHFHFTQLVYNVFELGVSQFFKVILLLFVLKNGAKKFENSGGRSMKNHHLKTKTRNGQP